MADPSENENAEPYQYSDGQKNPHQPGRPEPPARHDRYQPDPDNTLQRGLCSRQKIPV